MSEDIRELLHDQAALLFERHCTRAALEAAEAGAWPADLWAAVEDACLADVLVPEDRGGIGGRLQEAVEILRAMGAATAPLPLAEAILGRWLLGETSKGLVGLGFIGKPAGIGRDPAGDPRTGIEIPWAGIADSYVLVDQAGGELHMAPRDNVAVIRTRRNLAGEPRELVIATSWKLVGKLPRGASPLAVLALFRAAQISGGLSRALTVTIEYSKQRLQFGRAIASFQAIQQMLAEAAGHVAATAVAVDVAAASPNEVTCAAAKIRAGEAAGRVCAIAHQIVGALGYTREYNLHRLTRRLWSWRDEAGDDVFWQARLGAHAFDNGAADDLWAYVTAFAGG